MFRISSLSDEQDFRAYSTGDARWFQRLHEKDIKGSYTDSRIEVMGPGDDASTRSNDEPSGGVSGML